MRIRRNHSFAGSFSFAERRPGEGFALSVYQPWPRLLNGEPEELRALVIVARVIV